MKRPQFSLRALMIFITVGVVLCWAYWIGWPRWQAHLQQARFERAVKQLKIGVTSIAAWNLLPHTERFMCSYTANSDHFLTGTSGFNLTNGTYFVHYRYPKGYQGTMSDAPSTSVEVFRLPPVPPAYSAKRKVRYFQPSPGESSDQAYEDDFSEFVTGDRKDDFGLKCELIYSDPPAPTQPPR